MRITVLARRFEGGSWNEWEHVCNEEEVAGVLDSAKAKGFDRALTSEPTDADYLEGARYVFNRAYGTADRPAEGDVRVTKVDVSIVAEIAGESLSDHLIRKRTA